MQFNTVADTNDTDEQNSCASNRNNNESLLHFTIDVMSNVCMTFFRVF